MATVVPLPVGDERRARDAARAARSEAELVARARDGERPAREALFRKHLPGLRALAFRLLPRDHELDDILQETFAVALTDLHRLRDAAAFEWWIRGILINLVRKRLRRRRLLRTLGLYRTHAVLDEEMVAPRAPPDVAVELRAVYASVQRLDADTRTVLLLHRVEEMTLHEIADVLRISHSTAKRRLKRAEHELAIELERRRRGDD